MSLDRREALGAIGALSAIGGRVLAQQLPPAIPPGAALPAGAAAPAAPPSITAGRLFGRMTGAKAAVAAIQAEAVPCVYGVPGAQNNELWDGFKTAGLPYLLVTNESSASIMADASARATGRTGVFAVVPGPGLTNALTGIGEAWLDSVPIVAIVTDVQRGPGAPTGQVHSLHNAAILRPVTKAVLEVHHPGQIPSAIWKAFRLARAGEPGPTAVVIPYDLLSQVWDFDEPVPPELAPPWDEAGYRRAVALLADRKSRIGIYAGLGCAHAARELTAVAEMLQAPVATSVSGKGVIDERHPLAVGWGYGPQATRAAERRFRDVDVVLAIGVRYSEVSTANYSIPVHDHVIHVDANANNLGKNLPTCVPVHADSAEFLKRLLAEAGTLKRQAQPQLSEVILKDRDLDRASNSKVQVHQAVDPMHLLWELNQNLGAQGVMCVDVTASTHWAAEVVEVDRPGRYIAPTNNQAMGWAIPAAVGIQRLDPTRRVVCVTGDGCLLMTGLEMSTAARSVLPVKFFVLDDGAYHYMQMLQEPAFGRTTATKLANIDYQALAKALGLAYAQICTNAEVHQIVPQVLAAPGPMLTRVAISYEGREIRWLSALKRSYLNKLGTGQKLRMAGRLATRRVNPMLESD